MIPVVVGMHDFHKISGELSDSVSALETYEDVLDASPVLVKRLRRLVEASEGIVRLDVSEVDKQYQLLLKIQSKVVDDEGGLLDANGLKELSTMVSSMGSVISLYMKAQKDINIMKGEANLKAAVLAALQGLPEASREEFFSTLESYKS